MSDYYFARSLGNALVPADSDSESYVRSLVPGEVVRAVCKKDRNPGHHRKFFALLGLVFKNQDTYLSLEALRFAVMIASGYVDEIQVADKVHMRPRSLSWASMDQTEFDLFYRAALEAIPRLLPSFQGIDLDKELLMSSTNL